jgi:hypothetical protein
MGLVHIAREPAIVTALNPVHAWNFLVDRGWQLFAAVGAIVLALTGAEALYADIGHFGRRPIRMAWTGLVLPSLAVNYLGQGALLMVDPSAIENPFYRLFPDAWVLPALVLATLAAIIASQAVISGAYSLTRQAIQLGFLPRMAVRHTSVRAAGQIYMPAVNWALLASVAGAVLFFGSSSALAGAYGIAVTLTMMITTLLTYFVVREGWRLPAPLADVPRHRRAARRRLCHQVVRRRLVPSRARRRVVHRHDHVVTGASAAAREDPIRRAGTRGLRAGLGSAIDEPGGTHGGVSGGRLGDRAPVPAAQPQAQPGAARA